MWNRPHSEAGFGVVMCDKLWLSFRRIGELALKRVSYPGVDLLPRTSQQGLIGRILNQRVPKEIARLRQRPAPEEHSRFDKPS